MRIDLQRRGLMAAAGSLALPSGAQAQASGGDILVGQIGPFTGTPVPAATQINRGIKAAFAQINGAGGIQGRRLALFELDDGFEAQGFVRQFHAAMKLRPVALLSPVGTDSVQRLLDDKLLDTADVLVLNAVPGADSLRSPGHERLLHIRASDRQQVESIVRHAATLGVTQMTVVYQDVSMGTSGLGVAQKVAAALGMKLGAVVVDAESEVLAEVAARVAATPVEGVLVLGSPRFGVEGIVALRKAGYRSSLYALSYVSPAQIHQLAEGAARGVGLAQVYPDPNGRRMALQSQFQTAMRQAGTAGPYSAFHLEGYVTARVLAEGLRRAREPSPTALLRAWRTMGDCDLGGYHVNFVRSNVGSGYVEIAVVNGEGRLVY